MKPLTCEAMNEEQFGREIAGRVEHKALTL
jgi:hypothetical protein